MRRHLLATLASSLLAACAVACDRTGSASSDTVSRRQSPTDSAPARGMLGTVVSGPGSTVRVAEADSAGRVRPGPVVAGEGSDALPRPQPTASHPSLAVACDSVSAMLTRRLREPVERTDDTTLSEWRRAPGSRGCVLQWEGTFARTPNMSEAMWDGFREAGWVPVDQISADGPDGSSIGMLSRTSLCIARTEMDGGDDGDSTYVAKDWWRVIVECDDDLSPARPVPD